MALRVLVIGFGFMGQTHCASLLQNPMAELVGIVDPCNPSEQLKKITGNRATVRLTMEETARIPHYSTLEEAVAETAPDAAIVAVPTRFHCEAVTGCIQNSLHTFVEKPFALEPEECAAMCRLAKEKKLVLAVGYVVRYSPEYRLLHDTVANRRLGNMKILKLFRWTGIPVWGNWNDGEFVKKSGGALYDLVSHDIDIARYCLGEPDEIEALLPLCRETYGSTAGVVMHYGEALADIQGGFVTPPAFPFQCGYTAFFEKGTLEYSSATGKIREYAGDGTISELKIAACDPYRQEIDAFVSEVLGKEGSLLSTGTDAAITAAYCHTIQTQMEKISR